MSNSKSIQVAGRAVRIANARSKKGIYSATLYNGGKMLWKSMDSTLMAVAETRARAWALAVLGEKWEALAGVASKATAPTLGDIVEVLLSSGMVRERTAREYASSLLRLVGRALGSDPESARSERVTVLSAGLADRFVAVMQGLERPDYSKTVRAGNNGINSTLANAKAAFGGKLLRVYEQAGYPCRLESGLRGFLDSPRVQPEPVGFRMPSLATVRELVTASVECEASGRVDLFLTTQLMLCMGMDAGEVLACRGSWLADGDLVITARPDEGFQGKTANRGRRLAVPSHLVPYVVAAGPNFVVAPELGTSARWDLIYREHSTWLRQWFPAEVYGKSNHSLRKLGGTLVADRAGSARAGAQFLGNLEATFERHYSGADSARCLELDEVRRD